MASRKGEYGETTPYYFTPPLRKLTKRTSLGYEFLDFVENILHESPYPWQEWLAVHALETRDDGSLRFSTVLAGLARQNGKSKFVEWLAKYWLYVDSERHPDKVSPRDFTVVGVAQVLDVAKKPYSRVVEMVDPKPPTKALEKRADPAFQELTDRISRRNGDEGIICKNGASYLPRAALNARGLTAARTIFDELREQKTEDGWAAVEPLGSNVWSSQLWAISSAGDYRSKPLRTLYDEGVEAIDSWNELVVAGGMTPEEYADGHDTSFGFFWWGIPDSTCPMDDERAILAANPTIGYGSMTIQSVKSKIGKMSESKYRQEYLNQWFTADVVTCIDMDEWRRGIDPESCIADDGRIVVGVDTSADRSTTYISVAGFREDGLPHVETIARRDGMLWVRRYMRLLRDRWPSVTEVAVQSKGCPAVDFADELAEDGWTVHLIEGFKLGACLGRFHDRIREGKLRHRPQPAIEQQVSAAVSRRLGEVEVWDRTNSPMQISGLIAESEALYALEAMQVEQQRQTASSYVSHDLMVV